MHATLIKSPIVKLIKQLNEYQKFTPWKHVFSTITLEQLKYAISCKRAHVPASWLTSCTFRGSLNNSVTLLTSSRVSATIDDSQPLTKRYPHQVTNLVTVPVTLRPPSYLGTMCKVRKSPVLATCKGHYHARWPWVDNMDVSWWCRSPWTQPAK